MIIKFARLESGLFTSSSNNGGHVKSRKRDFQPQYIVVALDVEYML